MHSTFQKQGSIFKKKKHSHISPFPTSTQYIRHIYHHLLFQIIGKDLISPKYVFNICHPHIHNNYLQQNIFLLKQRKKNEVNRYEQRWISTLIPMHYMGKLRKGCFSQSQKVPHFLSAFLNSWKYALKSEIWECFFFSNFSSSWFWVSWNWYFSLNGSVSKFPPLHYNFPMI